LRNIGKKCSEVAVGGISYYFMESGTYRLFSMAEMLPFMLCKKLRISLDTFV
jgi:hypothetical protein